MGRTLLGRHWAAIDIGTTKICALVAGVHPSGSIDVIGMGQHPSHGLKKGVVVDIASTVNSIKKAVRIAEDMAGVTIESAYVGISGGHIQSFNSHGVVAIKRRDVSQDDIDRVIEAAKAIPISRDRDILHILPQYFKIDGGDFVKDSLGMSGVRLEAQVHIITGAISSANNIIKCCELAGVRVDDIILEQLASAEAVLSSSERDLGIGILDIGGGTTDFAIYKDGRIRHSKVVPVAGNHFTNDLAIGLRIPTSEAEALKRKYGFVWEECYFDIDQATVPVGLGYGQEKKEIDTYTLYEILNPRAIEIFEMVLDELVLFRLKPFIPYGLVLTGGGSLLSGMKELAEEVFDMPVRIGMPHDDLSVEKGESIPDLLKSPIYSTGYGLLACAIKGKDHSFAHGINEPILTKVFKRMKAWIYDFV